MRCCRFSDALPPCRFCMSAFNDVSCDRRATIIRWYLITKCSRCRIDIRHNWILRGIWPLEWIFCFHWFTFNKVSNTKFVDSCNSDDILLILFNSRINRIEHCSICFTNFNKLGPGLFLFLNYIPSNR